MLVQSVFVVLVPVLVGCGCLFWVNLDRLPPDVLRDDYFGPGSVHADDVKLVPHQIRVDADRVDGFRSGWSSLELDIAGDESDSFELGVNPKYLKELNQSVQRFDWPQHERYLNTFKQFMTEIEGVRVHFFRHSFPPKKDQKTVPLLLVHGAGSSSWDFYKVLPILANPSRFGFDFGAQGKQLVFDVIVPSVPGFGFSEAPVKTGLGAVQAGRIFAKLMDRLGQGKYVVHGSGALGSRIASIVSFLRGDKVLGLHLANPFLNFVDDPVLRIKFEVAKWWFYGFEDFKDKELPQNPDVHVNPRLIGTCQLSSFFATAFLMSRWAEGINHPNWRLHPQGGLQSHNTVDELLTEAHIYWLFGNAPHFLKTLYFTESDPQVKAFDVATVQTPVGVLTTPRTPYTVPSRYFYEHKFKNIVSFTAAAEGGEFVAIEDPNLLAKDIFSFVELAIF